MERWLRATALLLALFLSGCNLDVEIVGKGTVHAAFLDFSCSESCSQIGAGGIHQELLGAEPADGYRFLGFVGTQTRYTSSKPSLIHVPLGTPMAAQEMYVEYGINLRKDATDRTPHLEQAQFKVLALFEPSENVRDLAYSFGSICRRDATDSVQCWGKSADRALAPFNGQVRLLTGDTDYEQLRRDICLLTDSQVYCWNDETGQDWIIPPSIQTPKNLVTHQGTACVLHQGNSTPEVLCFNQQGELATNVPPLQYPTALREDFNGGVCVDDVNGSVCWGFGYYGQSKVPVDIDTVSTFAVGAYHTCAIAQGQVRCWGSNEEGQLDAPADLTAPSAIIASKNHTCVYASGDVACWGDINLRLTLVDPTAFSPVKWSTNDTMMCVVGVEQQDQPYCVKNAGDVLTVSPLPGITALATEFGNPLLMYALAGDQLYAWQLKSNQITNPVPLQQAFLLSGLGYGSACTNDALGFSCWNFSWANEQLEPAPYMLVAKLGLNPISISHQVVYGCAVEQDFSVRCWGESYRGALSVPDNLPPVQQIGIGVRHGCALSNDQQLICWGELPIVSESD